MGRPLILLDRDGVLNRLVIDPEHGTIDSPLHPDQVELLPGVDEALARLTEAGWRMVIVSNQPAAAKGKTTEANLLAVHEAVLAQATRLGGRVVNSHFCWHRAEDACECRKPKPGLLREALAQQPGHERSATWMVGDGVTDLQAGAALELRLAFLGPRKCDHCKILQERGLQPHFWGADLREFVNYLLNPEGPLDEPACR